jgi:hypothetical protein
MSKKKQEQKVYETARPNLIALAKIHNPSLDIKDIRCLSTDQLLALITEPEFSDQNIPTTSDNSPTLPFSAQDGSQYPVHRRCPQNSIYKH